MNAQELAAKFNAKIAVAAAERDRQTEIAVDNAGKRIVDVEHCKIAMERHVLPVLTELKQHLGEEQFSFAPQIELNDHRPVGVSFKIGDGAPTTITTAFGNIVVTRIGDSGTSKGSPICLCARRRTIHLQLWGLDARKDGKTRGDGNRHDRKLNFRSGDFIRRCLRLPFSLKPSGVRTAPHARNNTMIRRKAILKQPSWPWFTSRERGRSARLLTPSWKKQSSKTPGSAVPPTASMCMTFEVCGMPR